MNLRSVVTVLLSAALLFVPAIARAEMKVAVVDVQRAVMQTEDGLRAQATLKKLFDAKQVELDKKQVDLGKQKEDIDKQAKVLSKEALQKRIDDWQKQMVELQSVFVQYNQELQKKQKELTDPIIEKVLGIVKQLAAREGIDLIVDRPMVAYVRTDLDLTDKCIQMYNSGGAPPPSSPAPAAPAAAPQK